MKKIKIQAVHEHDLDKILSDLGLLEDLEKNILKCYFCGCEINRENFNCLFPYENNIRICCSNLECYLKVSELFGGGLE